MGFLLLEMNFKSPWMSLSHCSAKTQAALLPRDREREGERKSERGRDGTYSIQKEVEKEFEWREREEAECDSTEWEKEEKEEGPSGRERVGDAERGMDSASEGREHQRRGK